mgnify:CR=1 FL=1
MEKQKNVYAPGDDPDTIEANRAYQDALKKLTESLDQRKNRFFEPTLLAAAQGFLQPGTSNFFDSLGNVAGNIAKSQEAQIAEDQAIAQQRFELAGRGVELQRQKGKDAMWRSALEDKPAPQGGLSAAAQPPSAQSPAAGSGALPSGGQGATGPLAQAAKSTSPSGSPFMPGQQGLSQEKFFAAAQIDGKTLSDTMKEWEAIQKGQIQIKDKFGVNTGTGEIFHVPSGTMVPTQVFREDETVGTYLLPEHVAAQLSIYLGKGDADSYFELANKYIKAPQRKQVAPAAAVPGVPAAVGAAPTAERPVTPAAPGAATRPGLKTVQESEREAARQKALEDANTQNEIEARKELFQKDREAQDSITTANMLRGFSEEPNAAKMVGILSNDKVSSAIATLAKEGVGSQNYRLAVPGIETVMRNAKLGPEDQAKFRVLLMNIAQMRLQMSKYMKGSVSNFEQELMGQAVVTTDDTPQAIQMKADILTRRAQFDRMVSRKFDDSNMTAKEFLKSDDYQKMRNEYDQELRSIALGMQKFQSGAGKPSPAAQAGTPQSAANQKALEALRKELAKGQKKP